jgi:Tfp pilus assembly protein PilX
MKKKLRNEKGIALVVLLSLLLIMTIIGIGVVMEATNEVDIGGNEVRSTNSFWAAEAGAEKAMAAIRTTYQAYGIPPSPLPCDTFTLGHFTVIYSTVDNGPAVQTTLTTGSYKGLYALCKTFTITSTGIENKTGEKSQITEVVQDALIPVYQFAVFYEGDLEIHPGPTMTLAGRVHTNSNMYLGSENLLNIDSYTTAAGSIYHDRKAGAGRPLGTGDVKIKDAGGVYRSMKNADGTWLDCRSANWVTASAARWGGKVEDKAHGITELYLPVVRSGDQIDMIRRAEGNPDSYENQAKLKIIPEGILYRTSDTTWTDVTTMLPSGTVTTTTFFDAREGKYVTSKDIDIGKLNTSGYFPSNGVLYASGEVIRLKNGSSVLAPMTVASNNPLYTIGNFNTVNKKPVGLMTDALTILSGSWNDAKSDSSLSKRVASNTTVNCCFMTGNQNTGEGSSSYNGGLENLLRFLENWDSKSMTFRGSMVDIWNSEQAVGHWSYGTYYTAPNRDWSFDPDLLDPTKLPPGYPKINVLQKVSWSQG